MNLYKLTQTEVHGYDTYNAVIVAAETEAEARRISPCSSSYVWSDKEGNDTDDPWKAAANEPTGWCHSPESVTAELIGVAVEGTAAGLILASYNAS